jgi:hypothetical protein
MNVSIFYKFDEFNNHKKMKTLKIFVLMLVVIFIASACSQNHYAKGKRKMKAEIGKSAVVCRI